MLKKTVQLCLNLFRTDVDECSKGVCNKSTSTCNNTIGSYNCICNEGYAKDSSTEKCEGLHSKKQLLKFIS